MLLAQIQLSPLDYVIVGLYAVVVIALGVWFAREQKTSTDYILAGRSMGWIVVGISQLASLLSAISYLGNPGEAYAHNCSYMLFSLCGYLSVPIVIYFFLNFFYRLQVTSIYEYLERRFNYPTRVLASLIFVAARLAWMATIVTAISIVMEKLTGLDPKICIVATTVIATCYTLVGGMKAIIWTDVIQFFLFTFGLVGTVWIIIWKDGAGPLMDEIAAAEKLTMLDFSFDPTARITVWACVTAGMVNGLANLTDQVSMQRYLSTSSLREAQKAVWLKPFLSVPLMILTFVVGFALFGHYQLNPELAAGIEKPDQAFPHFILHELSGGLAGLIIAAIFAAAMSSIDSGVHTISTVCVEDYYRRVINPGASDHRCLNVMRALIVVWAVVIAAVALAFVGADTIVGMMFSVAAPFFGCAVGLFLLGTATRRATSWGAFFGALIGYGLVLWVKFGLLKTSAGWSVTPWLLEAEMLESAKTVSKFWLAFVSFFGTVVSGYLISCFFPRPQSDKLKGLTVWSQ
jgi:SSS family transporter